jgi:hypothetical protein
MSDRPIYEQLHDETPRAWEAFRVYRDMGVQRSQEKVCRELGKSGGTISKWSLRYKWSERVKVYDLDQEAKRRSHLEQQDLQEHERKLEEYRQQTELIGKAAIAAGAKLLGIIQQRLKTLKVDDIKARDLGSLAKACETWLTLGSKFTSDSLAIEKLLESLEDE